jgi:hypothetical protein
MAKKSIVIDGVAYVPEDSIKSSAPAVSTEGLPYVIARTYSAGVFAGYLKERNGQEVTLLNARRLWYWAGAASLSQLAEEGVSKPKECKFPQEVVKVELLQTIEILQVTETAREVIASVPAWKE